MGCFVTHDHPGVVSGFFLAVDNYNEQGVPRHDLGLYEAIWSAAAVGVNLWLGNKPLPRGFFTAFMPIFYAPVRFFLDYLREVPTYGGDIRYFGFTPGQYGSMLMLQPGWALHTASSADRIPLRISTVDKRRRVPQTRALKTKPRDRTHAHAASGKKKCRK